MTNVATLAIIINLILWLRVHLTNSRGKVFSLALSITGITLLASPLLVNLKFIVFYILLVSIIPSIFKPTGTALVLSAKNTSTTTATQRLSLIDHKAQANGLQSQLEAAAQTLTQLKNEQTKMWSQMSQMDHQLIAQQRAKIKKIYDVVQQLSTENTHQVDMYHQDKRLSNVDDTRLHQQLTQQKEKLKRMRIDADQLFREIKQKKKVITLAQFSKNNQASILPLPKGFLNKKFTFCTSLVNRLHQDLIAGSKKRTHLQNKYQQTWNQGKVFYASKVAQQKSDIQQFNSEMHQLHLQYHRAKNVVKQLKKDNPDHAYAFNIIDQSIDKELQKHKIR